MSPKTVKILLITPGRMGRAEKKIRAGKQRKIKDRSYTLRK
jgi:hypothetical protein